MYNTLLYCSKKDGILNNRLPPPVFCLRRGVCVSDEKKEKKGQQGYYKGDTRNTHVVDEE